MKAAQKYPMSMILMGILGILLSSIFVKYSEASAAVTAACRLLWTVLLSCVSGFFLAVYFVL